MKLEAYQRLKRDVDEAKSAADRAAGIFDAAVEQIKKEFGCATYKEAEAKLVELEADALAAEKKFKAKAEEFGENWKHVLVD